MWLQDGTVIFGSFIIDYQKNPNFDKHYLSNPWSDFDKNCTIVLLLISSSIYLSDETAPEQYLGVLS